MGNGNGRSSEGKPLIEWLAALVGLVLTLALLGFVGWQAISAPERMPPSITAKASEVTLTRGGFVVQIVVKNASPQTAARVEVEGTLTRDGSAAAKSSATFDYIPGNSERKGGLFFSQDPRSGELDIRTLGYAQP